MVRQELLDSKEKMTIKTASDWLFITSEPESSLYTIVASLSERSRELNYIIKAQKSIADTSIDISLG